LKNASARKLRDVIHMRKKQRGFHSENRGALCVRHAQCGETVENFSAAKNVFAEASVLRGQKRESAAFTAFARLRSGLSVPGLARIAIQPCSPHGSLQLL
jgi:hypothetical protein